MNENTLPKRRRGRRFLIALLVLAGLLVLSTVAFSPSVPAQPRPTAQDVAAARETYGAILDEESEEVRLDNPTLAGVSALLRDAANVERLDLGVEDGVLRGTASVPLLLGTWWNLSITVTGEAKGFPPVECELGLIAPPSAVCRWVAEAGRVFLRWRGSDLPPLDAIVKRTSVEKDAVLVEIDPPRGSGVLDSLVNARRAPLDAAAIGRVYCALVEAEQAAPARTLDTVLQRAFADKGDWGEPRIRSTLVAVALFTVGEPAYRLQPDPAVPGERCTEIAPTVTLRGRDDLAKHWAFSAGLTAAFGSDAATDLGEWKELQDSLPRGSGFSFVDLAADRSGVRFARLALEGGKSEAVVADLRNASPQSLLPDRLLSGPEGLSDRAFVARFEALDAASYAEATKAIDRALADQAEARPAVAP